ncbi:hypothetical protein CHS0354_012509 [Potamilus streckersoni]|uniref:Glycosyltransferase n=1 Tax=Potamilus streckersoni TaxID=2493646 RepID=A0AAE0W3L8_9BIVA|nr:hypothetical protein CHS0354_012509 [Potamilus streckersoni]
MDSKQTSRKRKRTTFWGMSFRTLILILVLMFALIVIYQMKVLTSLELTGLRQVASAATYYFKGNDVYRLFNNTNNINKIIVQHEFAGFRNASREELVSNLVPNIVYYVWCENATFEFKHYLSVLSVWKVLQPDMIEFHYFGKIIFDPYNDWFNRLLRTIPGFHAIKAPSHWDGEEMGCDPQLGLALVDDRGGIYVSANTIIADSIFQYRKRDVTVILQGPNSTNEISILIGKSHNSRLDESIDSLVRYYQKLPQIRNFCDYSSHNSPGHNTFACVTIPDSAMLYPEDYFSVNSSFGNLVRTVLYGNPAPRVPLKSPGAVPKVVHYVWFGSKNMTFMMYLSMLSTLYIVNPEKVYIHSDGYLHGTYYDKILKDKRVVFVYRERPGYIYTHRLLYSQHRSDIVRGDVLLKYGGIYLDWDVLWLRPIDDLIQSGYDAIANFDHMRHAQYPNTINLGVFLAKPRSAFLKRWQDALVDYKSDDFLYNAVLLPYKVYENLPETLYIERRLQVMCYHLKCHPAFHPNFHDFSEAQEFDWRNDVYAIHFTFPDPHEYDNVTSLWSGQGMFADIGRYVLKFADKLPK